MYTITTDVQITRRKRVHYVMDDRGTLMFTDPAIGACLAWLSDRGETQFEVRAEEGQYLVEFTPLLGDEDSPPVAREAPAG